MGRYSKACDIESEVWMMKLADAGRGSNRALIDGLCNGNPPFPPSDKPEGPNKVNTSFLSQNKIFHDCRRQYYNAFFTTGRFFSVKTDRGPKHKRSEHGVTITNQINRIMKRSTAYRETLRNTFSQTIVHGIGPATWDKREKWCPAMQSIGDVMIPSRTLLTMDGMDKFAVYRRYTAEQLGKFISGKHVDSGWNEDLVKQAMAWAMSQQGQAQQPFENMLYSPERIVEDLKEQSGIFSADRVPTVNCWDFYFLDDEDSKNYGWKRRIVLDTTEASVAPSSKNILGGRDQFIFNSEDRNYASKLSELIHFQYGDGSTVAPFRYHNVRGLGLLLYAVCHLQDRLRCRFTEAVFENLMQYYGGDVNDEAEWILKASLLDKGFMPPGINFVKQQERWQINERLVETCMQMNRQTMQDNSSSFTQDFDFAQSNVEKTATQVTAEVSSASALVGSMLSQAYDYQQDQWREIARRFCIADSSDTEVRDFRVECLKRGVPEVCLDANAWDIAAERVIGNGNKQMELAQVNMLMQHYDKFGPKQQRIVLHKFTLASTNDPALTDELAPIEDTQASEGRIDAQMGFASLMLGGRLDVPSGIDERGFIEGLLHDLAGYIQGTEQMGGMATAQEIRGFDTVSSKIDEHIKILGKDPDEKSRVKTYGDDLGKLQNLVKAYKQRLQEKMQKEAEAQQQDPEAMAKVQATILAAKTKSAIAKDSHAQKVIQKQQAFDQKQQHSAESHALKQKSTEAQVQTDLTAKAAETQQDLEIHQAETAHDMQMAQSKHEHEKTLAEKEPKGEGESSAPARSTKPKKGSKKRITFERNGGVVTGATVVEE